MHANAKHFPTWKRRVSAENSNFGGKKGGEGKAVRVFIVRKHSKPGYAFLQSFHEFVGKQTLTMFSNRSQTRIHAVGVIICAMALVATHPVYAIKTRKLLQNQTDNPYVDLSGNYLYTGDGTEYTNSISRTGATDFTCSFPYLSPWSQQYFVALNRDQWDEGKNCGRCVKVTCVDPRCRGQLDVTALVIDQCPECKYGDLDFSLPAWNEVSGMTPDRVKIAWNFTTCYNFINDTIRFDPVPHTQEYWQAFVFSNSRYRPLWVKLNGIDLNFTSTNFWVNNGPPPQPPYTFEMSSWGGAVIRFTVNDIFKSQDTGVQFPGYYADSSGSLTNNNSPTPSPHLTVMPLGVTLKHPAPAPAPAPVSAHVLFASAPSPHKGPTPAPGPSRTKSFSSYSSPSSGKNHLSARSATGK